MISLTCDCGVKFRVHNLKVHLVSKKHREFVKSLKETKIEQKEQKDDKPDNVGIAMDQVKEILNSALADAMKILKN